MPTISVPEASGILIDRHPDQCPICHSEISPVPRSGKLGKFAVYKASLEVLYLCPSDACGELFIAYFEGNNPFKLKGTRPIEPMPLEFSEHVKKLSQCYCSIFAEAHKAEEFGLKEICGVGYRKSLEFLIKDYLISLRPADKAAIETSMLGQCIEKYVTDTKPKEVAKRATWLGNDETHYKKRWADKDLSDLKTMIRIALYWIEAEYLTE
jgi:hypothetical protein